MSSASLVNRAYDHLHQQILSGTLSVGTVISEAALAKTLGISRTPVGEAIRQLAREGLVVQVPRYGTIVRSMNRTDLIELYEMREALESYAAARAAEHAHGDPSVIERLEQYCDAMRRIGQEIESGGADHLDPAQLQRFLAADLAFHMVVIRACGNSRISETVSNSRTISRLFRTQRVKHDAAVVGRAYEQHRAIVEAIRAGDAEAARSRMLEHILTSRESMLRAFDEQGGGEGRAQLAGMPPDTQRELEAIENSIQFASARSEEPASQGSRSATGRGSTRRAAGPTDSPSSSSTSSPSSRTRAAKGRRADAASGAGVARRTGKAARQPR